MQERTGNRLTGRDRKFHKIRIQPVNIQESTKRLSDSQRSTCRIGVMPFQNFSSSVGKYFRSTKKEDSTNSLPKISSSSKPGTSAGSRAAAPASSPSLVNSEVDSAREIRATYFLMLCCLSFLPLKTKFASLLSVPKCRPLKQPKP